MFIRHPAYIDQPPRRQVRIAFMLLLLWLTLPLAVALPVPVMAVFGVLWLIQFARTLLDAKVMHPLLMSVGGLAVAGLVFSQLGTILGSEGGSALLLLLVMLKAYESKNLRDWQIQLMAMVFLMGATVLLNQNLFIGLWLLVSLFATVCCAAMLNMPLRAAWRYGATGLLLTLPLTAVLFVAVPRLSEPLWRLPQNNQNQAKTGLSETMSPGSISNLVQNNQLAFNAVFEDAVPPRNAMYWRVMTMSRFNGSQWEADEPFDSRAETLDTAATRVRYNIIVRDEKGRLPALDYPLILQESAQARSRMRFAFGHTLFVRSHEGLRRFNMVSSLSDRLPERLSETSQAWFSRLPRAGNPRLRILAAELHAQSSSPTDYINRVLAYYRNNGFRYTLQPPLTQGNDRVDQFMFSTRQGFCEHYAESFVLMMRAAGLPARVVTGYLGGEYNEAGGFWQIRGRDAHAWAEVWLESEQAWLRIDPTGAVSSDFLEQNLAAALSEEDQASISGHNSWAWWARLSSQSQFYWQQWVVNFDQSAQQDLFRNMGLGRLGVWGLVVFPVAGLAVAILPLWIWWRRQSRRLASPLEEGFALIKRSLIDADETELAATGPQETLDLLREHGLLNLDIEQLLQQYSRWTYAEGLPSVAVQKRWYRQCRQALKRG